LEKVRSWVPELSLQRTLPPGPLLPEILLNTSKTGS